jgi:hypothetical protein
MIALLRYEVWRAFWAGLILTLLVSIPLLTHDSGDVQALLFDKGASRDLARLAIALPFGLALVQFGLERWRGLLPLLIHRGTPARKIHAAKSIVGLGLSALFLLGVLAIEVRLAVRSGQPSVLIGEALWVLPQLLCLAFASWSTGELSSRGSKRSGLAIGARLGLGYLGLHGLHAWGRDLGRLLPVPVGLWAYCLILGTAGLGLWLYSHRTFARPEAVAPASEPRIALTAAALLLCLWPNIDSLRVQIGELMRLRLEAVEPSLQVDGQGRVYELFSEERDFRLQPLDGGPAVAVERSKLRLYKPPPVLGSMQVLKDDLAHSETRKGSHASRKAQFQAGVQRRVLTYVAKLEDPDWPAFGDAFAGARRDVAISATVSHLLPDGRLAVTYEAAADKRHRRGESDRLSVEFYPQRGDGRPLSREVRLLEQDLLLDLGDGTFWRLDCAAPGKAMEPFPGPPGGLLGVEALFSSSSWVELALLKRRADGVRTEIGTYRYDGSGWVSVSPGEDLLTAETLLRDVPAPLHLSKLPDLLGRHTSQLIDGSGQAIREFDTSRQGRRAESRRRTLLAARLCDLPVNAFAASDPALGDLLAGRGLPGWVRPTHAALGLLAALAAALLQRGTRGRLGAAALGLLLGPLFPLCLHLCGHERRLARRAGPRGLPATAPVFSDREVSAHQRAA